MIKIPFYKHFRATTVGKAFILNAIAGTIIAVFAVELKFYLKDHDDLDFTSKFTIGITGTFFAALFTYSILFIVFNFGGGMMTKKDNIIKFKF